MSTLVPRPPSTRAERRRARRSLLVEVDTLASDIGAEVIVEVDDLISPDLDTPPTARLHRPHPATSTTTDADTLAAARTKAVSISEEEWARRDAEVAARITTDPESRFRSALKADLPPPAPRFTVKTAGDWLREAQDNGLLDDADLDGSVAADALIATDTEDATDLDTGLDAGLDILGGIHTEPVLLAQPRRSKTATFAKVVGLSLQIGLGVVLTFGLGMGALAGYEQWDTEQDTDRFCAAAPTMNSADTVSTFEALSNARPQTGKVYAPFVAGVDAFAPPAGDLAADVERTRADLRAAHQALLDTRSTVIDEAIVAVLANDLTRADAAFRSACASHA